MKRAKNQVRRDPALQAAPFPERRTGQRAFFVINWGDGWERAVGSEQSGAGLWRWLCSVRVFAPLFAKKGQQNADLGALR
ncbi:MAG: hypothetical protein AAFQ87_03575 [Bacteroidota bacterium]